LNDGVGHGLIVELLCKGRGKGATEDEQTDAYCSTYNVERRRCEL